MEKTVYTGVVEEGLSRVEYEREFLSEGGMEEWEEGEEEEGEGEEDEKEEEEEEAEEEEEGEQAEQEQEEIRQTQQELQCRRQRLNDRLRVAVITTAESEAQKLEMEVTPPVMAALADLTCKFVEQLGRDVDLFAQHAGRKTVNMDDILLATHRNGDVTASLRVFAQEFMKNKEQPPEKKRKRGTANEPDSCP